MSGAANSGGEAALPFEAIVETMPALVFVADPRTGNIHANHRFQHYTGLSPAALQGHGWADALHPDDRAATWTMWEAAHAAGGHFEAEYRLRDHAGAHRWHLARAEPMRADASALWIGTVVDIDDRVRARLALGDKEEMLRLAQDASGVGTFDWHLETDTLVWSPGCRAAFGLATDDPIDFRRLQTMIHPDDRAAFDRAAADSLNMIDEGRYALEYRVIPPAGPTRWIEARGRVLTLGEGAARRLTRFIGTVIDISPRKADEARLAEALTARDLLLHEVNHRVKNSLQVVTSLLMLQRTRLPAGEARTALDDARARIEVVGSIHQRLYQSGTHGRLDFAAEGRALAQDMARSSAFAGGQIALAVETSGALDLALPQAVPLALIMNELITNAYKYAWPGGGAGRLTVALARSGERVRLAVADDGAGLPPGFAPAASGGLGMRIVVALARQLRADLAFESAAPGTRVTLDFAVAELAPD